MAFSVLIVYTGELGVGDAKEVINIVVAWKCFCRNFVPTSKMALDQKDRSIKQLSSIAPKNAGSTSSSTLRKKSVPLHTSLARLSTDQPESSQGMDAAGSPGGMSFKTEATWEAFGATKAENDGDGNKRRGKRSNSKSDESFDAFSASFPPISFDDNAWAPIVESKSDKDQRKRQPDERRNLAREKSKNATNISTRNFASGEGEKVKPDTRVNPAIGIKRIDKQAAVAVAPKVMIWKKNLSSKDMSSKSMPATEVSTSSPRTPSHRRRPGTHGESSIVGSPRTRSSGPSSRREETTTPKASPPPAPPPASARTPSNRSTPSHHRLRGRSRDHSPPVADVTSESSISRDKSSEIAKAAHRNNQNEASPRARSRRNIRRIKSSDLQEFQLEKYQEKPNDSEAKGYSKGTPESIGNGTSPGGRRRRNIRRIKSSDLQDFQFHTEDGKSTESIVKAPLRGLSPTKDTSPAMPRRRTLRRAKSNHLQELDFHSQPVKVEDPGSASSPSKSDRKDRSKSPSQRPVYADSKNEDRRKRLGRSTSFKKQAGGSAATVNTAASREGNSSTSSTPSHNSSAEGSDRRRTLGRSRSYKLKSHIASTVTTSEKKSSDSVSNNSSTRSYRSDRGSSSNRITGRRSGDSVQSGSSKETSLSNSSKENLAKQKGLHRSNGNDSVRIKERRRVVRRRQSMEFVDLAASSNTMLSADSTGTPSQSRRRKGPPKHRGIARTKSSDDAGLFSSSTRDANRAEPLESPRGSKSLRGLGMPPPKGSSRLKSSKRNLLVHAEQGNSSDDRSGSPGRQRDKGFITSFLGSPKHQ